MFASCIGPDGGEERATMSWRPQYHSSKFRHVFGKPATKPNCYDGVPITMSVHDNHFCAVNPSFIAVITECAGGGTFLVIPIHHTGKIDPHHPRVCGHRGNVLDVKWNPFDDCCIASCSEDTTVKIWDIPKPGLQKDITAFRKDLQGHSRRVGLIEWHPTARGVLFSTAYDCKVMVWNLDTMVQVIKNPVKTISLHTDVVLSMAFNTDGSRLATTCKDKKVRVIEPRTGTLLQEASCKSHKANKVLYLGNVKMLLSTGSSCWNQRQIALWDQDDLSAPLLEEDLDGSSGVIFPFYDSDTHMLYLAGKGDGTIRYYDISLEKPYMQFLNEYRSSLPQKGLGVMPKRGLDVCSCEVFRFYRLVTTKSLIEMLSMIVPRRSECYQEDIYPMTAGTEPAMTAEEWLGGLNRGPVLTSLRPGSELPKIVPENRQRCPLYPTHRRSSPSILELTSDRERWDGRHREACESSLATLSSGYQVWSSPKTESQFLQLFYQQQEEIFLLREQLRQKDMQVMELELEIKNMRNFLGSH
ncbi:coronin-2A-like isoform X1 [Brienomyrus brachyistius]|uniref:coronin-2A-like isoform X1 n=2 Tax=Brienomyrus brachyistius TaxID=42636 RepID=UPI0020B273CB|nr:coronin-2A-like isoform X1 [Brienomyrus brachyistius]